MRHIRISIILAAAALAVCCTPKSSRVSDFTITVSDILSTKARVRVEPSNLEAYYCYGFLSEEMEYYFNMSDLENSQFQLNFSKERWALVCEEEGRTVSFTDNYCFRGERETKHYFLTPDSQYRIIVFQVDPKKLEIIGTPVSAQFHTNPLTMSSITFDISFGADKVTITPSNADEYYWDYENKEVILREYADAEYYLRNLIFMYEDYGFMEHRTSRGVEQWVFSKEDSAMVEGETCSLAVCGYSAGEVNSDITTVDFIYHKDSPCEVVPQE